LNAPDSGKTRWISRITRWAEAGQLQQYESQVLLVLTLIIGAIVGLVVVAFILLTENLGARMYPGGGAAWRRLVIPLLGSLGTGFLLYRYAPEARGSGIPQTKAALYIRDGIISLRTVLGKFSLSAVSLASGIALGREGPSVQVGAGIASVLGRRLGLGPSSVKALVPVGASAALAAAFNTPIAAVLFTLEEVMGDLHAPVLGSIVLSSATSWMVLHLVLGDEPLFHVPAYQLVHPIEFAIYAALGAIGGLLSVGFVKLLLWQRKRFLQLPERTRWCQPALGGLTVGVLGWFVPDVLGVGYSFVGQALNGQLVVPAMALLACLKVIATATCYASGNAGGIFGPSLFMGAMMGGAVGGSAHLLIPDYTGSVGAYALVGMGAAFAGIIRVPLTSVIMIFEITRDYSIIVPLMIANLISYFISSRLQPDPIYEALQHQDGIHLPTGARARGALLMVGNAYRPAAKTVSAEEPIFEVLDSVDRERGAWPVVDAGGLRGMVTLTQLEEAVKQHRGREKVGALVPAPGPEVRLAGKNFPHLHSDHSLELAMQRIAQSGLNALPVVSRTNVRELKGTLSVQDILGAYALGQRQERAGAEGPQPVVHSRLLLGVGASLIGLALLAGLMSYIYRSERSQRAQRYFQEGNRLVQAQRYQEAIQRYRNALSISHTGQHRLALAEALLQAGHTNEAGIYFRELLRTDPASGPANLGLARVYARQQDIANAVEEYRRAIYGSWPAESRKRRFETRIELATTLERAGYKRQAQAELMSAVGEAPDVAEDKLRLGRLLVNSGLSREAVAVLREVLSQNKEDPQAYAGIGDAYYSLGEYTAAREAFRNALKFGSQDQAVQTRLAQTEEILKLDPTARRLSARERFQRSQKLLAKVLRGLEACLTGEPGSEASAAAQDTISGAKKLLAHRPRGSYSDAAENNITAAERLWDTLNQVCGSGAIDAPTRTVMTLLSGR